MYGYQRWNLFDFFLHKTSKIFILCQIRYPEETSKGAGLIRRALLTLTHASNMLGNFQSSVKGFIILTPRNGSLSSMLKSPLWNSPAYLGRFNWDGNVVDNTFPPSPWDALMWKVSCFFLYQISLIPDMSDVLAPLAFQWIRITVCGGVLKELQPITSSALFWAVFLRKQSSVWVN